MYKCVICGYNNLTMDMYIDIKLEKPNFVICNCCGFESGFDDLSEGYTFEEYRKKWIKDGYEWFDTTTKPITWDNKVLRKQLLNININLDDIIDGKT